MVRIMEVKKIIVCILCLILLASCAPINEDTKVSGYRMAAAGDNLFVINDDKLLMVNKEGVAREVDNQTVPEGISYDNGWVYYQRYEGAVWRISKTGENKEKVFDIKDLLEEYYVSGAFSVEDNYVINYLLRREKWISGLNIYNRSLDTSIKLDDIGDAGTGLIYANGKVYIYCNNNYWEDIDYTETDTIYKENIIYSIDLETGIKEEVIKAKWLMGDFIINNNRIYYHIFNEPEKQNIYKEMDLVTKKENDCGLNGNTTMIWMTYKQYILYQADNIVWLYNATGGETKQLNNNEGYVLDVSSDGNAVYVLFYGQSNDNDTHQELVYKYSFEQDNIVSQKIIEIEVDDIAYPSD